MMSANNNTYHRPVLLDAAVEGLNIRPGGTYVDVTFGGGGHSRAILERLGADGRLIAFDRDADAAANAPGDERFKLITADFRFLKNYLRLEGIDRIDGLLADLGISSHQIDTAARGFSTRFDGPLDMRMDRSETLTAADIVNTYDEQALIRLLNDYGEVPKAHTLARAIVKHRAEHPIRTTEQLAEILTPHLPSKLRNRRLAQVFQALRIEVNGELESLKQLLWQATQLIRPGGRLAVITYHSLEDRLVKRFIQTGNFSGEVQKDFYGNIRKPFRKLGKFITPSQEEIAANPRARSAKLRLAERTEDAVE